MAQQDSSSSEKCPLCSPARETEWIDDLPEGYDFNVFRSKKNGNFMVVAKHHGGWELGECEKVQELRDMLFPGKEINWGMGTFPNHAHAHIEGTADV